MELLKGICHLHWEKTKVNWVEHLGQLKKYESKVHEKNKLSQTNWVKIHGLRDD
jgi:hypothetical protein